MSFLRDEKCDFCSCRSSPPVLFIWHDSGLNACVIHQFWVYLCGVCCFSTGHFGSHTSTCWQEWSDISRRMRPFSSRLRKRDREGKESSAAARWTNVWKCDEGTKQENEFKIAFLCLSRFYLLLLYNCASSLWRSCSTVSTGCCKWILRSWPNLVWLEANGCLEHLAVLQLLVFYATCAKAQPTDVHYNQSSYTLHRFLLLLQSVIAFRAHLCLPLKLSDCIINSTEARSTWEVFKKFCKEVIKNQRCPEKEGVLWLLFGCRWEVITGLD